MANRARARKRPVKKVNWMMRILLVAIAAFLFLKFVQLHVQMEDKQQQLIELNNSISHQTLINEDLTEQAANAEDILEREANDAGLYMPGQQIYQGSAG